MEPYYYDVQHALANTIDHLEQKVRLFVSLLKKNDFRKVLLNVNLADFDLIHYFFLNGNYLLNKNDFLYLFFELFKFSED